VTQAELDALVARGRQVHDDLLLARARGQVGFADLYMLGREAMRARDAAETLASRFENVAVLAQDAEADVARALFDALAHPFHNLLPRAGRAGRPRVVMVDSTDPDCLVAFLESFAVEQTLLVTLAKSGGELGALAQHGIVRDMLKKRLGPGYQDHLVVVTDPMVGALREEALREGVLSFEVPGNVPARFAALTPLALFPAALAGADVRGVLAGAHAAAEQTAGEDLRVNPAYLLAATLHLLARSHERRTHLFVACTAALNATAVQLARLFDETTGRRTEAEGGAASAAAAFSLPRDSRSLVRRCTEGRDGTAVVLLEVERPARDRAFPRGAPGLEWLAERPLSEFAAAERHGVRDVLRDAGVPVVVLRLPALSSNAIGALHMHAMLAASFGAGLAGLDPLGSSAAERWRRAVRQRFQRDAEPDADA
jgi:glucose-6-phosphate isomerase